MTQHLITRAEWGAVEQDGFRDRPLPISEWFLHHSVTVAPDLVPPFGDDDAAVRTLERIGEERFGGGISYTFPVTPAGRIYQGHSLGRQGAHTKGHNTAGAAFVLVGDYSRRSPTAAQVEAIAERMVLEHRAGRARTHQLTGGHRDVSDTECPGDGGYAAIGTINRRARELWAGETGDDDMYNDADRARDDRAAQNLAATWRESNAAHVHAKSASARVAALEAALAAEGPDRAALVEAAREGAAQALAETIAEARVELVVEEGQG